MPKLPSLLSALIFCTALLASAVPAAAQDANPAGPVSFDYYLLSLSVGPGFCALSPHNRSEPECKSLTARSFRQTPLTVHGLWPNRLGTSIHQQPEDCAGPRFSIPPATAAALRRDMPGGNALERHEWQKHGTCSGLSPADYFAAIVRLDQQANAIIGPPVRDAAGGTLQISSLLNAVSAQEPTMGPSLVVYCQTPKGGGPAVVSEIRMVLSKDFTPRPASSVGMGQNSGCPHGAGQIPSPRG